MYNLSEFDVLEIIDKAVAFGVNSLKGEKNAMALQIAASSVLGSAQMVLQSESHPWALIDQVCSPGGTTIQGVTSLQVNHFESTIYEAVDAVTNRDTFLQKQTIK